MMNGIGVVGGENLSGFVILGIEILHRIYGGIRHPLNAILRLDAPFLEHRVVDLHADSRCRFAIFCKIRAMFLPCHQLFEQLRSCLGTKPQAGRHHTG